MPKGDGESVRPQGDTVPAADNTNTIEGAGTATETERHSPVEPDGQSEPAPPLPPPPPSPEDIGETDIQGIAGTDEAIPPVQKREHLYAIGFGANDVVGFTDFIGRMCETTIVWTDPEMDELIYAFENDPTLSKLGFKTKSGATWVAITVAKKTVPPIVMNSDTFIGNIKKKFGGFIKSLKGIGGKIGGFIGGKRPPVPDGNRPK